MGVERERAHFQKAGTFMCVSALQAYRILKLFFYYTQHFVDFSNLHSCHWDLQLQCLWHGDVLTPAGYLVFSIGPSLFGSVPQWAYTFPLVSLLLKPLVNTCFLAHFQQSAAPLRQPFLLLLDSVVRQLTENCLKICQVLVSLHDPQSWGPLKPSEWSSSSSSHLEVKGKHLLMCPSPKASSFLLGLSNLFPCSSQTW